MLHPPFFAIRDSLQHAPPVALTEPVTLQAVYEVATQRRRVAPLSPGTRVDESAAWVAQTMTGDGHKTAYYGINTGFGDNAGRATFQTPADAERLSRNLLLSHCIGVGEPLSEAVVRAALFLRAASLAKGYSGVRRDLINTLVEMLNRDVYPVVPSQGSLGASGDLAPLAHLVMPLSAPLPDDDPQPGSTGYCFHDGAIITGAEAMQAAGIPQIRLGAKEGVALINGTAISTAIGILNYFEAVRLLVWAEAATALSAEALRGFRDAFLPHVNQFRSREQAESAQNIYQLLDGSTLIRGGATIDLDPAEGPPQDPYCLRCAPVVHGAIRQTLAHVERVLTEEADAVTDNPLVFGVELPRTTKVISGGNFHGEPIAFIMDFLAIAAAELANISERRIFTLTDPKLSRGLPPFLIKDAPDAIGLNSGLMIAQYTAASLVSENKALAHPASVDSIPSSANREDHVSMSTIAARKAAAILNNVQKVIAIELLCASQALSLRLEMMPNAQPGDGSRRILDQIRALEIAPGQPLDVIRRDVPLTPYVDAICRMMG
jgi:histidine ammonia-lyase